MIVKDEEPVLARCLNGVKSFADEIIIVDTGSSDATKNIARAFTDKVYDFEWNDDFAAARNYSYSLAGCDYIMWLDADNIIEAGDAERIAALKSSLAPDVDVVFTLHRSMVGEGHHETALLRDRLIRRSLGSQWIYPVHEGIPMSSVSADGEVKKYSSYIAGNITIWHKKEVVNDPGRNIRIFEKMLADGTPFTSFNYAYYCRELYLHRRYQESYEAYLKVKSMQSPADIAHALTFAVWSLQKLERWKEALEELTGAFAWVAPTPLLCCEMGNCFKHLGMQDQAEFWYMRALSFTPDLADFNLVFPAYYEYIPCLKLSKLYARKGLIEKAVEYNERAAAARPDSVSAALNRLYFESLAGDKRGWPMEQAEFFPAGAANPLKSDETRPLKLRQFELKKWNRRPIVLCGTLDKVARAAEFLGENGVKGKIYICDDDRAGESYHGIDIIGAEALAVHRGDNLLLGSKVFYQRYLRFLPGITLGDWFFMSQLLMDPYERKGYENMMYFFFKRRRESFIVPGIDLVLTQRCNLRCRHCANRMQYYTAPHDYEEEDYLESFARVLKAVDGVASMRIIGGEPLLLQEKIEKVIERFGSSDKIFCIDIPTNGTLPLKERTASVLAGCPRATVLVNDYGAPSRRVKELMAQLKAGKISHMLYPAHTPWFDMGDFICCERSGEETQNLYQACLSKEGCATLLGHELYLCPVAAHGAALAAVPRPEDEYVDLRDDTLLRERLFQFFTRKTHLQACRFCLGGKTRVPRGVQAHHALPYQSISESGELS